MNWTRHDTRALIGAAHDRPRMTIGAVKTIRRHHGEPGLVERMARLERFVRQSNDTLHIWGTSDCSLMMADWVLANGHPDPAFDLRGTYGSEEECFALLDGSGGLAEVVATCAEAAGLVLLREPEFGCVAVIGAADRARRQWSAIWNGHRWLVRWVAADGRPTWTPFVAKPLAMWRV